VVLGPGKNNLAVQSLRDSIDRDMAHDYLASQKKPVYVMTVNFLFASNEPPPLSWHLTNEQIEQISQSWREKDNQEAWTQVRRELGCSTNPTILQENRTH